MKATAYEHTTVAGIARAGAVRSASDREQPRQLAARYSGVRGGQEGHIRMWSRPKGSGCCPLAVAGAALVSAFQFFGWRGGQLLPLLNVRFTPDSGRSKQSA